MDPNIPAQPVFQPEPQIPQQPVQPVNPSPNKPSKAKRILLLVLGVLEIFFPVIGLYLMFSLLDLQHTLGINLIKSIFGIVFFAITILLAVFQIIAGIFGLEVKLGNGKIKGLMITGIILAVFTIPAIMLFIIYPTYNAVSTENSPSPSPTTINKTGSNVVYQEEPASPRVRQTYL
jgi:succinate dehydrogenase hydrophobic anchor subunit